MGVTFKSKEERKGHGTPQLECLVRESSSTKAVVFGESTAVRTVELIQAVASHHGGQKAARHIPELHPAIAVSTKDPLSVVGKAAA